MPEALDPLLAANDANNELPPLRSPGSEATVDSAAPAATNVGPMSAESFDDEALWAACRMAFDNDNATPQTHQDAPIIADTFALRRPLPHTPSPMLGGGGEGNSHGASDRHTNGSATDATALSPLPSKRHRVPGPPPPSPLPILATPEEEPLGSAEALARFASAAPSPAAGLPDLVVPKALWDRLCTAGAGDASRTTAGPAAASAAASKALFAPLRGTTVGPSSKEPVRPDGAAARTTIPTPAAPTTKAKPLPAATPRTNRFMGLSAVADATCDLCGVRCRSCFTHPVERAVYCERCDAAFGVFDRAGSDDGSFSGGLFAFTSTRCFLCGVECGSTTTLEGHCRGKGHAAALSARRGSESAINETLRRRHAIALSTQRLTTPVAALIIATLPPLSMGPQMDGYEAALRATLLPAWPVAPGVQTTAPPAVGHEGDDHEGEDTSDPEWAFGDGSSAAVAVTRRGVGAPAVAVAASQAALECSAPRVGVRTTVDAAGGTTTVEVGTTVGTACTVTVCRDGGLTIRVAPAGSSSTRNNTGASEGARTPTAATSTTEATAAARPQNQGDNAAHQHPGGAGTYVDDPLAFVRCVSSDMTRAELQLLTRDLELAGSTDSGHGNAASGLSLGCSAVVGFDTETAPRSFFPDVHAWHPGPHLLQLALPHRVWLYSTVTDAEADAAHATCPAVPLPWHSLRGAGGPQQSVALLLGASPSRHAPFGKSSNSPDGAALGSRGSALPEALATFFARHDVALAGFATKGDKANVLRLLALSVPAPFDSSAFPPCIDLSTLFYTNVGGGGTPRNSDAGRHGHSLSKGDERASASAARGHGGAGAVPARHVEGRAVGAVQASARLFRCHFSKPKKTSVSNWAVGPRRLTVAQKLYAARDALLPLLILRELDRLRTRFHAGKDVASLNDGAEFEKKNAPRL